ncbi:MAG: hypothetical protein AVDCRST_MAG19-4057 [uncultured Thermomicrobiales bacterium]|uniref:Uncharacterized protein n=1 Tax=uncultured Thermomicrobiales bacterium TaxID=1645740 RepID=A0A6J4VNV8_9BACT|nr:MAG: hypothetical protein AVDCRST_MAG19-4057 [uncultured Thermomicrobiales bacterium]
MRPPCRPCRLWASQPIRHPEDGGASPAPKPHGVDPSFLGMTA